MTATTTGGLSEAFNPGRYPGATDPSLGAPGPSFVIAISGAIVVDCDPDSAFRELHDPEGLVACVPGASLTRLLDRRTFEARILVGVGPFKIAYSGAGRIVASNPRQRTASIAVTGRSGTGLPSVRVRMSMAIRSHPRGSEIRIRVQVGIADRSGLLGHGLIDSVARDTVDRTMFRIKQRLEEMTIDPPPAA